MIPALILKLLSDMSYYFTFAWYLAVLTGATYSLPLTLGALVAAGTASALLEKKGNARYIPVAAAFALLLQVDRVMDLVLLAPPLLYLLAMAKKQAFWPNRDDFLENFGVQWKSFGLLVLISLIAQDLTALQTHCLPLLVSFLACAILELRMLRHEPAVLMQPRFQVQNGITVAVVAVAAICLSSGAFWNGVGGVAGWIYGLFIPVLETVLWGLAIGVNWLMNATFALIAMLRKAFGTADQKPPEIQIPENPLDESALDQNTPENAETVFMIMAAIMIVIGLVLAYFIFKRLLGSKKPKPAPVGFGNVGLADPEEKVKRDPLIAPKEPRAAVRYYYRRFLRFCLRHDVPLTKYMNSRQVNDVASGLAAPAVTEDLRALYIEARYSDNAITEEQAKEARELWKKIRKDQD